MRKEYDRIERLASEIVMKDIKTLQAAKAAEASHGTNDKNGQQRGLQTLVEGKVKDLAIRAKEGDKAAQKTVSQLTGGSPKRRVKTLTQVAGQKLRIVGKKIVRGVERSLRKGEDIANAANVVTTGQGRSKGGSGTRGKK
jgi:hypothetical protein